MKDVVQGSAAALLGRPPARSRRTSGAGRILLVEDEELVRSLVPEILEEHGYLLTDTGDPEEAIALWADGGPFDLLLTDVVMPGLNGRQLADRLAIDGAGLKVLYMSGYASQAIAERGVLEPGTTFVQKPFTSAELAMRVRDVLDGSGPAVGGATARS